MTLPENMLLLIEIFALLLKILYYTCESIYKSLAPIKRKSVAGEIVLVRTKFAIYIAIDKTNYQRMLR